MSNRPLVIQLLCGILTLAFPIVVLLIAVRLVMTPLFLQFEYTRPGFPEDFYGFTTQDRLTYAPFALEYLLNGEDIDFLGKLQFPDGVELYSVAELQHMRDVKVVTEAAFLLAFFMIIAGAISVLSLQRLEPDAIRRGFLRGSILTLSLIATVVILAVVSWDTFFTTFHTLFFEGGTWQFAYSDTLIRLFPEQFWFDAALSIGGLAVITSLITVGICTLQLRNRKTR